MDTMNFTPSDVKLLRLNFTSLAGQDDHFMRCWSHQDCRGCLNTHHCSWCPYTSSCVANSHKIPLLAPAYHKHMCPSRDERWELRTRPFGCQVSTVTSLSAIISVVSTFVFIVLLCLAILCVQRVRRYSKEHPGWWRFWVRPLWQKWRKKDGEREPLLSGDNAPQVPGEGP